MIENKMSSKETPDSLVAAWKGIESAKPGIRIRDAAAQLNVSEAQLLATTIGSEAIRLKPEWKTLLKRLPELGRIMSLTRNEACILEHKGAFEKVKVFGKEDHQMATVIGPIETRVFLKSWYVAYAVKQYKSNRELTSIQIFDHEGHAITKIFLQEDSDYAAYVRLIEDLKATNQERYLEVNAYEKQSYTENINKEQFLKEWSELKDTHDFFPLLKNHQIHRFHALELAKDRFAKTLSPNCIQEMLEKAAAQKLPIMIFAGNRGNLQIHQDTVRTIRLLERGHSEAQLWLNVLDPNFNMHLRIDLVKYAWIVTKPTKDGDVTSIECYDENKELVVQFFGLRKPGNPELNEWRDLLATLENEVVL